MANDQNPWEPFSDAEGDKISEAFAFAASLDERNQSAADEVIYSCVFASRTSTRGACVGAIAFLDQYGAGMPEVDWYALNTPRQTAARWAMSANQIEIEAYLAAAVTEMEQTPVTSKALKRLAAIAWKAMSAEDRVKFRGWINNER